MSYLLFKIVTNTGKTFVWEVTSRINNCFLGTIKWYGSWRKYVFYPSNGVLFDAVCLEEILIFIKSEMEIRKNIRLEGDVE